MFLPAFKAAAAEGAVLELKLRLLAGKVPALQKYAHQKHLEAIEDELATHFGAHLSLAERETLRLCRQLRNKVLHSDFRAAREKLRALGAEDGQGGVVKIDLPVVTRAAVAAKLEAAKAGMEGVPVSTTASTDAAGVFAWFLEAASAGDFQKAVEIFARAAAIADRLADIEIA
jgi:hypothetical protein